MLGLHFLTSPRRACLDAGLGKVVGLDVIHAPLIDVPEG
jgi:hypothetical protein